MSFEVISYTSMQQIPQTDIRFNVVYGKGNIYFHFSLKDVKQFVENYEVGNPHHEHIMGNILKLLATDTKRFSHLQDAETWLRNEYGLIDLQWRLRRVSGLEAVCERDALEIHIEVNQYPTIEGEYIRIARNTKNSTAKLLGFSDTPVLILPLELGVLWFEYTSEEVTV